MEKQTRIPIMGCNGYLVAKGDSLRTPYYVISTKRGARGYNLTPVNTASFVLTTNYGTRTTYTQADLKRAYEDGLDKYGPPKTVTPEPELYVVLSEYNDVVAYAVTKDAIAKVIEDDGWDEGSYRIAPLSAFKTVAATSKIVLNF